jgi:SAM-dependent methyltransferase
MPTVPRELRESHVNRQMAESFGTDAARYDRSRPRYPEALIRRIAAGSPGTGVLDVGCGTGIAARQFQAAGCTVRGADVDERMADYARGEGLEVEVAKFEDWDAADRRFDTVIAAQAWHWIDPVAGAAKAARLLRPGGRLAIFWSVYRVAPELAAAFGEVFSRVVPDSPFKAWGQQSVPAGGSALYTRAVDGIRASGAFAEPEEVWQYEWPWTYSRDQWLDQVPTTGGVTSLPPDKLAELLEGYGAAVDAVGGGFTMDFTTEVAAATLADGA